MPEILRERSFWLLWLPVVVVAAFYALGFDGFWHGDDLPNLHRAYSQSQQGTLWPETFRQFAEPVPSQGAFYRPMMMFSLALNFVLAGAHYAGWYAVNFSVHLLNTLLVALIVTRLTKTFKSDATVAAPLAALLFGLCPAIAEGVYWVSARSDGWVTLFSLTGLYVWAFDQRDASRRSAFTLPLLLILALGFKESAAVLPLQMALVAIAWPVQLSRTQRWAVFATFVVAALSLAWRTFLFGNAWYVYTPASGASSALHSKLWAAGQSLGPWWTAQARSTAFFPIAYLACCAGALLMLGVSTWGPRFRLVLALACASGGLAVATLLNVGSMSSNGEGGRLGYGPIAWLAIAIGVSLSREQSPSLRSARFQLACTACLTIALLTGCATLWGQLRGVWDAQRGMRMITQSVVPWAESHPGLTMLLVPDSDGVVVMARNAQAGLVLEPIQTQPYLHRVLPTLSTEVQLRQEQFCQGMAQRLEIVRPRFAGARELASLAERAETVWPRHVACWSLSQRKIIPLLAPPLDATCDAWLSSIRAEVDKCDLG